jgi:Na+-driven multidrug efflux pump
VTAEKPTFGLIITVAAGLTNMLLDWLFMAVFRWGITGAAAATAIAQMVGGIIPLVYFIIPNKSKLRLGKTQFDGKALLKTCTNGSSEFMSNISLSVVSMLYNYQLMKLSGEDGVSTYGVLMYVNFIFIAAFIGYSVGSAPIVGYHHGAGNHDELKGLFRKSLVIIGTMSVAMFALAELLAVPLGNIFVGYDDKLLEMTVHAFRICSLMFIVCGLNIYGSGFFTALNNGLLSALISFARTLVFQVLCVLLLPMIFGLNGIWWSVVVSDVLALVLTAVCLLKERPANKSQGGK